MMKKLLLSTVVIFSTLSFGQDTTAYRMVGCSYGELTFFNNDSTDMISIYPAFGSGHVIFSNPEDSLLYMVIDMAGNSGDRNIYTINPFSGATTLVADLNVTYPNSGDLGEGNVLYLITGNGDADPGNVIAVNMSTFVETPMYTSVVAGSTSPTATEYNPLDSSLYIYESYGNNLYRYNLATATESVASVTNFSDDEHHGAFYDEVNNVFHLGSYGGDMYISDNTYLNGGVYNSSFSSIIDLCLIEHTISADTNYFSGFCPGEDSVKMSLIYSANSVAWYKDGIAISGATNSTFWASQTGIYRALIEIGNGDGYMWSEEIELDLFTVPVVTLSSASDSLICYNETSITIEGVTPGGGSVQWYMNGAPLPGETNQNLVVTAAGIYNQVKTNLNGCSDSSAVSFQVFADPTPINVSITQAMNDSLICGSEVIVLDGASGTVQWYMNGIILAGETNPSYTASSVGNYNQILTLPSGCSDSAATGFTIYIEPGCGVGIDSDDLNLEVFPNPVKDLLMVRATDNIQRLTIVDASGRIMYSADNLSVQIVEVDMSTFAAGIYTVQVQIGDHIVEERLVK